MDFNELMKKRQSCRKYSRKPVEAEKLTAIIEAARHSPSACNSQPWHFIVVNDSELTAKFPPLLQGGGFNKFANDVPVYIIICEEKARLMAGATCGSQHYAQLDVGSATAYMTLQASDLGLSTCVIGYFDEPVLKEMFGIPEAVTIRLLLAVGYDDNDTIRQKSRKDIDKIASYNKY